MSLAAPIDPREEMDVSVPPPASRAAANPANRKTQFLIRTLPRDCNPTPLVAPLLSPASVRKLPLPKTPTRGAAALQHDEYLPDNPFDDITEEKLQKLSGKQDLARVTYLQISVDSGKQSVEMIGELLPSLQQLKLQHSTLHSFRDLGTSLRSLRILWVMRSGINDLDGIGALTGLQELYLQYNDISDLSPLTLHEEIQVIDLEGNCVEDVGQIEQLAFCAQLTTLNLEANPVCKIAHYRQIIANFLPQLTTLDDKPITDDERAKISDEEIDAAIRALRDELLAERCAPATIDDRLLIADGIKMSASTVLGSHFDERSPRKLSRTSSAQRIAGFDPAAEAMKNDSGSTLTHGTDIVFAGNVTSSLRRHRSENESDAHCTAVLTEQPAGVMPESSRPTVSSGGVLTAPLLERPKTPARMSITDTLDRAHELETQKHKSRDAIMKELRSWQQEGAISQLGATHVASDRREKNGESGSSSKASSKRRESSGRTRAGERRPNTSAGVLRNGASVREAFVDSSSGGREGSTHGAREKKDNDPVRLKSPAPLHRRSSYSSSTTSSSSNHHVDILILDESDERRPCSPTKSSKGIFTTGCGNREWNLDALSPKLDLSTAETSWRNFPQTCEASQLQNDRVFQKTPRKHYDDDDNEDGSSSSDGESVPVRRNATARKAKAPQGSAAFFNVAESLHAIDRWRDDMDNDDDKKIVRVESYQHECISPKAAVATETAPPRSSATEPSLSTAATLSPQKTTQASRASPNQTDRHPERQLSPEQLGPANFESDDQIVQYMREKHKVVAETKTRDGFRRYFKGIEADRLERILQHVFADQEKVRRRLQLMTGFYRHELGS